MVSNGVRSSQVGWDPPDCKECLRVNVSGSYTIMNSMELVKMYLNPFLSPLDSK